MLKIAICDDVCSVCEELYSIITQNKNFIKVEIIIDIFYGGEALIDSIKENGNYDLIFLDIELGKINGVEIGHIIREDMEDYVTKIIYISSKSGYDRQLFEVQPLHFLQKPLDEEKVLKDVLLALKILGKENQVFEFKVLRQIYKIPFKKIIYFESMAREIILKTVDFEYKFYGNIDEIEKMLNSSFIKPHRSYIVNYEQITMFKSDELSMSNGDIVPISRGRKKEMLKKQVDYEQGKIKR